MNRAGRLLKLMLVVAAGLLTGCAEEATVPILGERVINPDTGRLTDYRAPHFRLTTHRGEAFGTKDLAGKIHLVDFFFTSCPTICPTMTENMRTVHQAFPGEDRLLLLSHTIDPKRDTPDRLRQYADRYNIDDDRWYFLTGDREDIFDLASGYKVQANSEEDTGGDIFHDGTFVLLDEQRRIRGYYNGLEEEDIQRLIHDLSILLL